MDLALEEGPQTVSRYGREVIVIVGKDKFERRRGGRGRRGTILPFLRGLGFVGARLDLQRSEDLDRPRRLPVLTAVMGRSGPCDGE